MALAMTERGIGLEIIQREIALILFDELNDEIEAQSELWELRDKDWNKTTGQDIGGTKLEKVKSENFHQGHRPSLVEKLPKPNYPNISIMVYAGRPTNFSIDQATNFQIRADIEIMCKSEKSESEVDRRIHRTTEAVHQVLTRNENLNRTSLGWENDPTVQITDIFKRREQQGGGKDWYWQAARISYNLTRRATLPE
jgi:hypothetical protein